VVDQYTIELTSSTGDFLSVSSATNAVEFNALIEDTQYNVSVTATDNAGQVSNAITGTFKTTSNPYTSGCDFICITETDSSSLEITVKESNAVDIHYIINSGNQLNLRMPIENSQSVYGIDNLNAGDEIRMFFTVIPLNGGAYDTEWVTYVFAGSV